VSALGLEREKTPLPVSQAPFAEPDSIVTAVTAEEPLPFLEAEMVLWGVGITALMIPLGFIALLASPLIVARNILRHSG
jgi:hypothetical protein